MTHDTDRRMTRRAALVAGGSAALATVPGAALAQTASDDEAAAGLFGDASLSEKAAMGVWFFDGFAERAWTDAKVLAAGARLKRLDDYLADTVAEFEAHTDDWLQWVNDRDLGSSQHTSLRTDWHLRGSEATRYILADHDGDQYTGVRVTETFDGAVDHTATLQDLAVMNAADELATLHERYIVPNEDIDESYASYLAGKYARGEGHMTASFLGEVVP